MTRRAYVYFVVTFILGAIVGGAGVFLYGWYAGHWHHDFNQKRIIRYMTQDLKLDDGQVQKLTQILDESGKKRKELEQKLKPQFDALHEETRNQIRLILLPGQLARFNEYVRRSDERKRKQKSP